MATITQKPTVQVQATFVLDEEEMRALDALVGYGVDAVLNIFYYGLGETYLKRHEDGLRRLFQTFKDNVPAILGRADKARDAFAGTSRG